MNPSPIFESDPHERDETSEIAELREAAARPRWADDGLAPDVPTARPVNPLHPLGLFGSVLGRR
jgi:hypothetical protein